MTSTTATRPAPSPRQGRRRRSPFHRLLTWGVFLATVLGGAYVIKSHPAQYASSATIVIVGSESISQREARSEKPVDASTQSVLARFGNLTVVGDIVARTYQSWTKQTALDRAGLKGRLLVTTKSSVASDTPDHGPVIVFTVVASTPLDAQRGVQMVVADVPKVLASWQQGSDPNLSVSDASVTIPAPGLLATGSRSRSAVAVVAFAALLAWLVGQMDLARARRRRARRMRREISDLYYG